MTTRDEVVLALRQRYSESNRRQRRQILDEFVAVSGFHRKYAARLLRGVPRNSCPDRKDRRIYDDVTREALVMLWEASDRICSRRLKAALPLLLDAMERHGHQVPQAEVQMKLLRISAATIDRVLNQSKAQTFRRRNKSSIPSIRRSIAVRTYEGWDDPAPGYMEMDLVLHSGGRLEGSYLKTLVLTDVATGWTECMPLLIREQHFLIRVLEEIRVRLPFPLRGLDVDNDSIFINEVLKDYCRLQEIEFTRCRPYRKNDQAWVEQKNGAVVRRAVGYRRYEGLEGSRLLSQLYEALRGYVNFFQPSFKLQSKERQDARVIKRYYAPATPCRRLLNYSSETRMQNLLMAEEHALDPIRLLRTIRLAQEALVAHSDQLIPGFSRPPSADTLDTFLNGLKTAWHDGPVVLPVHRRRATIPRGRTVPDPIAVVTSDLEQWFNDDVTRTSRDLFNLLQIHYPGQYPESVLRTIQRRLKGWRAGAIERFYAPRAEWSVPPDRAAQTIQADANGLPSEATTKRSATFCHEAIRPDNLVDALHHRLVTARTGSKSLRTSRTLISFFPAGLTVPRPVDTLAE